MRKWVSLMVVGVVAVSGLTVIAADKPPSDFQTAMKNNGAAMQSVGKAVDAKDYGQIEKDAATLKTNFSLVGKYFTEKKNDAALTHCQAAFKAAGALETAAKAKNDMGIADARKAMGGACSGCHTAHREKLADGTFEIK